MLIVDNEVLIINICIGYDLFLSDSVCFLFMNSLLEIVCFCTFWIFTLH